MLQGNRNDQRLVWIDEAMHRAANLQVLAANVERLLALGRIDASHRDRVIHKAHALLDAYQRLDGHDGGELSSCDGQLRDIAGGLVEVFGHTIGRIVLSLELEPLYLAADRRRAVLLAASELVINALQHAFTNRDSGTIRVVLHHDGRRDVIMLSVADDGIGPGKATQSSGLGCTIVCELAAVLAGSVEWHRSVSLGGTEVTLTFPAPSADDNTNASHSQ
jgi:two-component sensor histidine kinase